MSSTEEGLRLLIERQEGFGLHPAPKQPQLIAHIQVYAEYLDSIADPRAEKLARLLELLTAERVTFVTWRRAAKNAKPFGYLSLHCGGETPSDPRTAFINAVAEQMGYARNPERLFVPDYTLGESTEYNANKTNLELLDAICRVDLTVLEDFCRV